MQYIGTYTEAGQNRPFLKVDLGDLGVHEIQFKTNLNLTLN